MRWKGRYEQPITLYRKKVTQATGAPVVTPFSQASPVEAGEGDRLRWKGRHEQAIMLYRKKVTQVTGAPIVTPTACHFPRLGRGKLIYRSLPSLPRRNGGAVNVNQSHIANARVLGTFSHTTCCPISFVLRTCFLDRSVGGPLAVEGAP